MKQYDMIISLGGNCAAAMQLDFRGLRKYSLPFDYLFMHDDQTIKWLFEGFQTNFADFFLRENMVELVGDERGDDRHGCVQYKDTLSGYRCIHAFMEHVETNVEHYNDIMSMFKRRFDRMFEKIDASKKVAFILATPFSYDIKLLKPLQKYLYKKYPHKIIDWYIVQFGCKKNDAKMFKLKTGVMYFYSYIRENNFDDFAKKDLPEWSFMDEFIIFDTRLYNKSKYKLPGYLLWAFMINLPFVRPFVKPHYIQKIRHKIEKYWY